MMERRMERRGGVEEASYIVWPLGQEVAGWAASSTGPPSPNCTEGDEQQELQPAGQGGQGGPLYCHPALVPHQAMRTEGAAGGRLQDHGHDRPIQPLIFQVLRYNTFKRCWNTKKEKKVRCKIKYILSARVIYTLPFECRRSKLLNNMMSGLLTNSYFSRTPEKLDGIGPVENRPLPD